MSILGIILSTLTALLYIAMMIIAVSAVGFFVFVVMDCLISKFTTNKCYLTQVAQ